MGDEPKAERGTFAKRIKALGDDVQQLRRALVIMANDMSRTGSLTAGAQHQLERLLGNSETESGVS